MIPDWRARQPTSCGTCRLGSGPTIVGKPSMQVQFRTNEAVCAWSDQGVGRDFDRVELSIQFAFPEGEELAKHGIARSYVHFLPDKALQQARVIGHVVQDLGDGQTIVTQLKT